MQGAPEYPGGGVFHRYIQQALRMTQQCLIEDEHFVRNAVVSPICKMIIKEIYPYSTYVVVVGFGVLVLCVAQFVLTLITMYNVSTLHKVLLR